jgi:hypothetical protein
MSALVEMQKGKVRPRALRADRPPKSPAAVLAAPFRDPQTGHFTAGNPGGRLRQVAALARFEAESLLALTTEAVAPFLRPHLAKAQSHVQELIDALPAKSAELVALCALEAKCILLANACVTEGARAGLTADEAKAWRGESREWMREFRQFVLTRKAIARDTHAEDDDQADLRRRQAEYQRQLAERQKEPTK